ncbi:MAG: hypothetical protein ACREXP_12820 [Steroidobacteraceae bacterium]
MKRSILALALLGVGIAASAATDAKRIGDFSPCWTSRATSTR